MKLGEAVGGWMNRSHGIYHYLFPLGYALSELRLYKQLKQEMDNQISQLQEALALSQDQYRQCIHKLENAEQYAIFPPRDR